MTTVTMACGAVVVTMLPLAGVLGTFASLETACFPTVGRASVWESLARLVTTRYSITMTAFSSHRRMGEDRPGRRPQTIFFKTPSLETPARGFQRLGIAL